MDNGTVVIVDPDDEARLLAAKLFKRAGFSVETVSTGEEAVELIGRAPPVAVILEIPLGTLSGYEVVRALREALGSTLPIVFADGRFDGRGFGAHRGDRLGRGFDRGRLCGDRLCRFRSRIAREDGLGRLLRRRYLLRGSAHSVLLGYGPSPAAGRQMSKL
jgi:hypothetical protein